MTNKLLRTLLIGSFVVGLAGVQAAPAQDRDRDEGWYTQRDTFYHGQDWKMRMFDRVRDDLNRVQSDTFSAGDEYRINQTKEQLGELQTKLAASRYDEPELDQVIGAMSKVVADNRLNPRDRNMLTDDLSRMRDYRAHHDNWR